MNNDDTTTMQDLKNKIQKFVQDRDWQQFHSPKNLSMALAIEAAELMEPFRFIESAESIEYIKHNKNEISFELADICIALLDFCELYDIDLTTAVIQKLEHNNLKYPIHKAKGSNKKYSQYDTE